MVVNDRDDPRPPLTADAAARRDSWTAREVTTTSRRRAFILFFI